jgi:antitoxin FitA
VHLVLRRRALESGQSLQEYLLARLTEDALQPTLDEVFRSLDGSTGGNVTLARSAEILREERDARS